ncbi:MAG: hypothetical protein M3Y34_07095 [Actinomycetota bacterium]|nr:hypothetical protein [Actinomycetota bacterium]
MEQAPMNGGDQARAIPGDAAEVSVHIQGVLEAAERAAAASVEQARAECERRVGAAKQRAQELVDERNEHIRAISDDLLRQAAEVEERLVQLDGALATAIEDLRGELERLPDPPADADDDGERDTEAEGEQRRKVFSR